MRQFSRSVAAALVATAFVLPAAGAQSLPSAQEVTAKYVAAIGGKDAIMALKSMTMKGTMEMPAMGMVAEMTMKQAAPNKSAMTMVIPGMGEILQGFDGSTAWAMDPMQGPRVIEGAELEAQKEEADFYSMLYDPAKFTSMEVLEQVEYNGEQTYRLKLVRTSGRESTEYFSVASGLLVGSATTVPSQMGDIELDVRIGDYKQFGPMKLPTKIYRAQAGQEINMTFTEITFDSVEDAAFAVPEAVKALMTP